MSIITRTTKGSTGGKDWADAATNFIFASEINADLNAMFNEFNGAIDDTNIKPGANILGTQLNLTGHIVNAMVKTDAAIAGTKLKDASVPEEVFLNNEIGQAKMVNLSTIGSATATDQVNLITILTPEDTWIALAAPQIASFTPPVDCTVTVYAELAVNDFFGGPESDFLLARFTHDDGVTVTPFGTTTILAPSGTDPPVVLAGGMRATATLLGGSTYTFRIEMFRNGFVQLDMSLKSSVNNNNDTVGSLVALALKV